VGKRAKIKREKIEQVRQEKKEIREHIYHQKNPWLRFWKRVDFWIYTACLIAVIAFPFVMKGKISMGDTAVLHTSMGDIEIKFYEKDAPNNVANFKKLAGQDFYKDMLWHRVIKGFVIQTGDPSGDGTGGPGYTIKDEINDNKFVIGAVGMANSGQDTNGSQFFIVNGNTAEESLNGKYTNFAQVVSGLDVVQKISEVQTDENDTPLSPVYLNSVELK
jgi:cyclophilin family peptidyl-prolyl cis-trans isomerase